METKEIQLMSGFSTLGMATGLYVAHKADPRLWTYVGLAIGGSILGVAVGKIIGALMFPPEK